MYFYFFSASIQQSLKLSFAKITSRLAFVRPNSPNIRLFAKQSWIKSLGQSLVTLSLCQIAMYSTYNEKTLTNHKSASCRAVTNEKARDRASPACQAANFQLDFLFIVLSKNKYTCFCKQLVQVNRKSVH